MTLDKFLDLLTAIKSGGQKEVIVVVDGLRLPFPDVTGVSENEDTVVIEAKVVQPLTKGT